MDEAVSEPGPEPMLQLTPELDESLTTESVKLCDPPTPKAIVAGLIGLRLMGFETVAVSGTLTDALFVESALLVAVSIAVAVTTGVGAVYKPLALIDPVVAVHVTPAAFTSLATVAVKLWVAPASIATGFNGLIATLIGRGPVVPPPPPLLLPLLLLPPPHPATRVTATKLANVR
jgi:hypothetical protein